MKYKEALPLAESWKQRLAPFCDRIEIAGSVRRHKTDVRDIELLCTPKIIEVAEDQGSLFIEGGQTMKLIRDPGFAQTIYSAAQEEIMIELGKPETGKYIKVMLLDHQIKLDIFTANILNWGFILAIRTGPAEYSHKVLGNRWVALGYRANEGMLYRGEEKIPVREEEDLYHMLGIPYLEPRDRQYPEKIITQ